MHDTFSGITGEIALLHHLIFKVSSAYSPESHLSFRWSNKESVCRLEKSFPSTHPKVKDKSRKSVQEIGREVWCDDN